ncbi:MAG: phosphomevalonate kinase [Gordonia sp. (in: high G+C Gram-positive bacteria)]|uniref:phosphomevalonate kinase n=1 Tax=Gordonia sp. (in: high G+C Gram-positive bacteria) TaxID=84139 RepID=UPI0039E555A5
MTRRCSVAAPGKLYIAGEYAVLAPGGAAVLIALDRFVTVHARANDREEITVTSDHTGGSPVLLDAPSTALPYVSAAADAVRQYARETGRGPIGADIEIVSELDDPETGTKYGLGSSGAVTAGVVQALAALHPDGLSRDTQLKLALLAVFAADPRGSGGDVATSLLNSRSDASPHWPTGWVEYRSPDREQLTRWRESVGIAETVDREWPGFTAAPLPAPRGREVAVGWTGRPASSTELVRSLRSAVSPARFAEFGRRSDACVQRLVDALRGDVRADVDTAVTEAGRLLREIGDDAGVPIETPPLTRLRTVAESLGAVAKTSGAGGGDCGIALVDPAVRADLHRRWRDADVTPLDLHVL